MTDTPPPKDPSRDDARSDATKAGSGTPPAPVDQGLSGFMTESFAVEPLVPVPPPVAPRQVTRLVLGGSPAGAPTEATPATPDTGDGWAGREATSRAIPAAPTAKGPAEVPASAGWLGRESTSPSLPAAGGDGAPAANAGWLGRESTSQSLPAASGAGAPPAAGWLGRESTVPSIPPAGGAAPAAADAWVGREATMASSAGSSATPGGAFDSEWLGRENTIAPEGGAAAAATGGPGAPTPTPVEDRQGTDGGRARTKVTSHLFDGWHMQGKKGPHTGKVWGDWAIGGMLGEGGMGAVYRALQHSLKRRVALKVLSPALAADNLVRQRFQQEASITSMLSSPNIVHVYAAGEWDGNHFFAMEFVEGTDLYDIIKQRRQEQKPFTPEEAANYIVQAARGLAEAGKYGIVHRDIKPPNLMVTKHGLVKIADFGIVKVMGGSQLTMAGHAVGTPSYVSPEQGRGESSVDQRSDLYSLGVVFYELLCGRKPFDGSTPNALIYQHCFEEPPLPKTLNPAVSDEYQAVVMRCLQKKPENRYLTAEELVKDLEDIRNGNLVRSVISDYKLGTGAEEAKRENMSWAQRNLLKLVAASVVVLLAGASGILYVKHRVDLDKAREIELRKGLVALDQAVPLPPNVDDRLSDLTAVVSGRAGNPDVVRWRAKVQKVHQLAANLALIDGDTMTAVERASAKADLDAYIREVGGSDQDARRWAEGLDRLQRNEDDLRAVFRTAETEALDVPRRTVLAPLFIRFQGLVPESDPQVHKWQQTFAEFDQLVKGLVERLSTLDTLPRITEGDRQTYGQVLARARPLLGAADERITRWGDLLARSRSRVDGYRTAIKERLAKEDQPSKSAQEAVKTELASLRALVDPRDPDLVLWDEQIAAANAVYDELRKELGKLDALPKGDTLEQAQIEPAATSLARYKRLALPGDADASRWEARIQASRDYLADLRERLKPLNTDQQLTLAQQAGLGEAMERFAAKGALDADSRRAWTRRLERERERVVSLRTELAAFGQRTAITPAMRSGLETFARDVGDADPDVQTWRAKLDRVDSLRAQLAVLDLGTDIPFDIDGPLARLRDEVGDDNAEMLRWAPAVKRMQDAEVATRPLAERIPLPADAAGHLAVLRQMVGDKDPVFRRRQGKYDRVVALKGELAKLPATYAQSPQTHARALTAFDELRSLVGDTYADLAPWADRLSVLDGPGRPAWAADYGRDQFGLWADAGIGKLVQRFRFVPPGSYLRGGSGDSSDGVQTRVTLTKAFWLAEDECTQALWQAVMNANPSRDRGPRRPVERVSWDDCRLFLAQLAQDHPQLQGVRLPNESEWEYACRADATAPFAAADQAETGIEKLAWFSGTSRGQSEETKLRAPNPLGLYDLQGNVWEWCQDGFGAYSTALVIDPIGNGSATRVVRGGSWGDPAASCSPANRSSLRPTVRSAYVGLRLAADVAWEVQPDGKRLMMDHTDGGVVKRQIEFGQTDGFHVTVLLSMPKPAPEPEAIPTGSPVEATPAAPVVPANEQAPPAATPAPAAGAPVSAPAAPAAEIPAPTEPSSGPAQASAAPAETPIAPDPIVRPTRKPLAGGPAKVPVMDLPQPPAAAGGQAPVPAAADPIEPPAPVPSIENP